MRMSVRERIEQKKEGRGEQTLLSKLSFINSDEPSSLNNDIASWIRCSALIAAISSSVGAADAVEEEAVAAVTVDCFGGGGLTVIFGGDETAGGGGFDAEESDNASSGGSISADDAIRFGDSDGVRSEAAPTPMVLSVEDSHDGWCDEGGVAADAVCCGALLCDVGGGGDRFICSDVTDDKRNL